MSESGRRGILLILSAPSGGGKSTLANRLRAERSDVEVSVSHTTRRGRLPACAIVRCRSGTCPWP